MPSTVEDVLGSAAESIDPKHFSWEGLARVVFLIVVGVLLINVILKFTDRIFRKKVPPTIHKYAQLCIKILLWTLLALTVLGSIGAEVTSIIALLSVAGLAVSMALQNTLANMAGGIVLLVVKPFQVGHYIETDGVQGTVSAMGLSYTSLVTVDNKEIHIPNSQLSAAKITNYSAQGKRRLDLQFSASYDDATQDVIAALKDALSRVPQVWTDPEPLVHLREYQSSSIVYETRSWINASDYWAAYFAIQEEVREAFQRHGVQMTYDHVIVHTIEDK